MDSFRNRLLALIIGLVVITQSVTLVAVLVSTDRQVQVRADAELHTGATDVQNTMRVRADQLSSTVAVFASDIGFKEAVAGHDAATMLSAVDEHSQRIRWDLVVFMDADGRLLTSNSPYVMTHAKTVERLVDSMTSGRDDVHLVVLGDHLYQLVVAPIKAPDTIAWMAMGFAVDDALAATLRKNVSPDTQVS